MIGGQRRCLLNRCRKRASSGLASSRPARQPRQVSTQTAAALVAFSSSASASSNAAHTTADLDICWRALAASSAAFNSSGIFRVIVAITPHVLGRRGLKQRTVSREQGRALQPLASPGFRSGRATEGSYSSVLARLQQLPFHRNSTPREPA